MRIAGKVKLACVFVNLTVIVIWIYAVRIHDRFIPDIWLTLATSLGLVLLHLQGLRPGSSHNMWSLVKQYLYQSLFYIIGTFLHLRMKISGYYTPAQQKNLLRDILYENRNTQCVKKFEINTSGEIDEFRSCVPLTSYVDYVDLADKVSQTGSEDVMFPGKADYIALTSGTVTEKSNRFPKKLEILKRRTGIWILLAQKHFLDIPRNNFLRKWLTVTVASKLQRSESGIRMGPISSIASNMSVNMCMYVTPQEELNHVTRESSAIYIYLVFGLMTEDIRNLFFPTASLALTFFKTLEREWKSICDDIEIGALCNKLEIEGDVRSRLNQLLQGGNADRAKVLKNELKKGMKGIAPRIWPTCSGLFCAATGSYEVQAKYLKSEYLGDLPMFSPFHAGTESLYGMNLHLMEEETTYVAMTPYNFFEFIPLDDVHKDNPGTVLAHEVKVGMMYEMVVTTWEGLYRYRTGDIIEVTHLYGMIPRYKFIRRIGDVLSATTERVPERFVFLAVQRATEEWCQPVYDMTSVENIYVETLKGFVSETPFYIVFLQLHDKSAILTSEEKLMVDRELCKMHEVYGALRSAGKMSPLKVIQLRYGTLEKVKETIIDSNQNISCVQYKQPRIIRREKLLRLLLDCEIET